MDKLTIQVIERKLSDASLVYDVVMGTMLIPAVTERDAHHLLNKMAAAIREHTNVSVDVWA